MIAGDSKPKVLVLEQADGTAESFASKAAFQAAGWDLSWRDVDGVALASQPTWVLSDQGDGEHLVKYTVPSGFYWVKVTAPEGRVASPAGWSNEGEAYDADSIAGLLLTNQGVPAVISAADADLGDVVDQDDWTTETLYIPLGRLTRWGLTFADLASGWEITAAFKAAPGDTAVPVDCEFVDTATGAFRIFWEDWPTGDAMELDDTATSKVVYCDVQLSRTSDDLRLTTNRYQLQIVWERNEAVPGP